MKHDGTEQAKNRHQPCRVLLGTFHSGQYKVPIGFISFHFPSHLLSLCHAGWFTASRVCAAGPFINLQVKCEESPEQSGSSVRKFPESSCPPRMRSWCQLECLVAFLQTEKPKQLKERAEEQRGINATTKCGEQILEVERTHHSSLCKG